MRMKQKSNFIIKSILYSVFVLIILLVISMNQLNTVILKKQEYQDYIKEWASNEIGVLFEYENIRFRLSMPGPEIIFYDVDLSVLNPEKNLIKADEIIIGFDIFDSIINKNASIDRFVVKNSNFLSSYADRQGFYIQGLTLEEFINVFRLPTRENDIEIIGYDIAVNHSQLDTKKDMSFEIEELKLSSLEIISGKLKKIGGDFSFLNISNSDYQVNKSIDLKGRLNYTNNANGWDLEVEDFYTQTETDRRPLSSFKIHSGKGIGENINAIVINATFLSLDDLGYFITWMPEKYDALYSQYQPSGTVSNFSIDLSLLQQDVINYNFVSRFSNISLNIDSKKIYFSGLTGQVHANSNGGNIEINSNNLHLGLSEYYSNVLNFSDANGTFFWENINENINILTDRFSLSNAFFESQSSIKINYSEEMQLPFADVQSDWNISDIKAAMKFLPIRKMNPTLFSWFNKSFLSGKAINGKTLLRGELSNFPFDKDNGLFYSETHISDMTLRYSEKWPDIFIKDIDLIVDGMHLYSNKNQFSITGNIVNDGRMDIFDLRNPVLILHAPSQGSLGAIHTFIKNSPISDFFGGYEKNIELKGGLSLDFDFFYPIMDKNSYEFFVNLKINDSSLEINNFKPPITKINGLIAVSRDYISSNSLTAKFLNQPIKISLSQNQEVNDPYIFVADIKGKAKKEDLARNFEIFDEKNIYGIMDYFASLNFPSMNSVQHRPFKVTIESNLKGIGTDLPLPFKKSVELEKSLTTTIEFSNNDRVKSVGNFGEDVRWNFNFFVTESGWVFDHGAITLGENNYPSAESRGLHIRGKTNKINYDNWMQLSSEEVKRFNIFDHIRSVDLHINDFSFYDQSLVDHRFVIDRGENEWLIEAYGSQLDGLISIPYDFLGNDPLMLNMQSFKISNPITNLGKKTITPDSLPSITVKINDFSISDRNFGSLRADFKRSNDGLRASDIEIIGENFKMNGNAGWVIDELGNGSSHSFVKAKIISNNVEETMEALGYQPLINSKDMNIDIDVKWTGGPSGEFLSDLTGEIKVEFGNGQLNEINPGAGRVFGLMSLVALPRRLSLDFSDVFEKGFGFDEIKASFRLENGSAYTCNLSLKGPAADIGIVGNADLKDQNYNQVALVSTNVGSTLPIVGAVVAGPQAAAALLLFSQIFKKPLKEMGQVYYNIDGLFVDPSVEISNTEQFTLVSDRSGCLYESL